MSIKNNTITHHKTFPIVISFNSSSLLRFYSTRKTCPRYIITTHINSNDVVTFLHGYSTVTRNCMTLPCPDMNLKNVILCESTTKLICPVDQKNIPHFFFLMRGSLLKAQELRITGSALSFFYIIQTFTRHRILQKNFTWKSSELNLKQILR